MMTLLKAQSYSPGSHEARTGETIKIKAKTTAKFYVTKTVKDAIAPANK
jgi:nucleoid DNA-binding protein